MLDSGTSCNFISLDHTAALDLNKFDSHKFPVRLANGKVIQTCGKLFLNIKFGKFSYFGPFHVLQCNVPLILGMEFLSQVKPDVDFARRTVTVCNKGVKIQLPTVALTNDQQHKVVQDDNQFAGLQVDDCKDENIDCDSLSFSSGCDDIQKVAKNRHVCQQCKHCERTLPCGSTSEVCARCLNHSQVHMKQQQLSDSELQSKVRVCGMEIVPLKQFRNDLRKQKYLECGLINLHNEQELQKQQEQQNIDNLYFTHRSTLGGGDDGDLDHGDFEQLASEQLEHLKQKYSSVFSEPQYPVDRSDCENQFFHEIPLKDETAQPPKRKLYPLDSKELLELKQQIQLFLDTNRIEPANGPYGAPILFAKKKDGGLRMCIDYRLLNNQTLNDVFPLPRIDELLQRLDGAKVFSKLDLRDGYHQIPMASKDKLKTSFTCRYGTYQFTVMPFGLSNAPASFQRMMNKVFFKLLDQGVLCYLDDLLIYSKDVASHRQLLDEVFSILQQNKLYIKESKCHLFLKSVNFLGHVVDRYGVSLESGKVDVISAWPAPENVNQVQQFLGLCNYYRRFVLRFSEIASPLTLLTRKGQKFIWTDQQQKSFDQLKQCLTSAPVLKVFDPQLPTRVVCDASNYCVGAVLEQQVDQYWHPIEYYSKRLNQAQQNYSATDREFVAVQFALQHWRQFLVGIQFTLLTDHAALTYLQSSQHVSRRNARWLEFLSQFTFDIQHIKGKENVVADTLSRVPGSEKLSQIQVCGNLMTLGIQHARDLPPKACQQYSLGSIISIHENKSFLKQLLAEQLSSSSQWFSQKVSLATSGSSEYQYRDGVLCKLVQDTFCPVVPDARSNTITLILHELHSSALGGHMGSKKLLKLVKQRFYWQNMFKSVEHFVKQCAVCQANKHSTQKQPGLLQPVENPDKPFQHVTMDFITHLPISNRGFDSIFTIVDRFSRLVKFIPCHSDMSAIECANIFFEQWVCKYGVPSKIISDRDVKFQSKFWQTLFDSLQCRIAMSTAYHPQTDGLSERFHRSLQQILRCYCSGRQEQWCTLLGQCEFALNSSFQDAVGDVPFKVVFGFTPNLPLDVNTNALQMPAVSGFVSARSDVQLQVKQSLEAAQTRMADQANQHRRSGEDIAVGTMVWLGTRHLPLRTGSRKLSPLWTGPFQVAAQVSPGAFRLDLPDHWAIHPVFHRSQLKIATGEQIGRQMPVQLETGDSEYEVECILGERIVRGKPQYLVKWLGYDFWENTWEPLSNLKNAQDVLQQFRAGQQRTRGGSSVRKLYQNI